MRVFPAGNGSKKNKGFTLVELVVLVSIFSVLLGILIPNLSSILGFRAKRASSSITAALTRTKTEAMDRLVGEMKLSHESDGYYITYYLDHGKKSSTTEDSREKIAPGNITITYTTSTNATETELAAGGSLIITYNRETGAFRPLQTQVIGQDEINAALTGDEGRDISFYDTDPAEYLLTITVRGGSGDRVITLNKDTGTYTTTVS